MTTVAEKSPTTVPARMSNDAIAVPENESPAGRCDYCGHPFPTRDRLVLHVGVEHPDQLDSEKREAFLAARSAEEDELRTLLLKATGGLVFLYFGLLFMYAIVT